MSIWENIVLALSGLKTSKMRSFLTMLGIIIGIGSVIAIVTVGNSLTYSITSSMDDLGANQIAVYVSAKEPNSSHEMEESDHMDDEMVYQLQDYLGDRVRGVSLVEGAGGGQSKIGQRFANVQLVGTNENYIINNNQDIIQGTDIRKRDVQRASNVAVISDKFAKKIFSPGENPLGKEVKVNTPDHGMLTFTVIGVYRFKVPAFMQSFASEEEMVTQMVIPVSTAQRLTNSEGYRQINIAYPPGTNSYELAEEIETYMQTFYRSNAHFTVRTETMEGIIDNMTTMLNTVSIAISVIAGISLLVGGIGVMNIMLVSVTERTREIGTRKALGAKSSAIRIQFIIESMILCLVGGVIGVGLGLVLGYFGTKLLGFPASPSVPVIVIAVLFSMVIGVFFGYYPANKAAKLDPIEALRYE